MLSPKSDVLLIIIFIMKSLLSPGRYKVSLSHTHSLVQGYRHKIIQDNYVARLFLKKKLGIYLAELLNPFYNHKRTIIVISFIVL